MFYTTILRQVNRQVCCRGNDLHYRLGRSFRQIKQTCSWTSSQREYISVPEFFNNKTVLITGSTGFVGQGLVEKMLRSCPDVKKIVLPIRASRKESVEDRFTKYVKLPVFWNLSKLNHRFHEKLTHCQVDLGRSDLGLQKDVHDSLKETVDVIIHAAANTQLDGPLSELMNTNLLGTYNVLNFAKQCDNLKVLVYVSTGYSNFHLDYAKEKVVQEGFVTTEMLNLASVTGRESIKQRGFDLQGSPVTYVFSKRITEQVIAERQGTLPVVIMRPSMITAAFAEPFPMWSYGKLSYNGIIHMIGDKILPYFPGYPEVEIEMVPVDFVVNAIITSAWMLGTGQRFDTSNKGPVVINQHSTNQNKITNESLVKFANSYYKSVENTSYRMKITQSIAMFNPLSAVMLGKRFKTAYARTQWKTFNTDIRDIEWRSYIHDWLKTTRRK